MNLPSALIQSLLPLKGFQQEAFIRAHEAAAPVSIRLNPAKRPTGCLPFDYLYTGETKWCGEGRYLIERPSFTADPFLHAGAYYVQEASSMFLEHAFRVAVPGHQPIRVLDLCAAPGGKSTHLLSLLPPGSLLVSNEVIRQRVNILSENVTKWGYPGVIVTNNDPADFQRLPEFFDVILVDAPCSGSGLFRKDPAALDEWSIANVQLCSSRQQRILADVLPALAPGGVLMYATCSYSPEEDAQVANWLLLHHGMASVPLSAPASWGVVETGDGITNAYGYNFFPHHLAGEGFYMSVFRKEESELKTAPSKRRQDRPARISAEAAAVIQPFIVGQSDWCYFLHHEQIVAFPSCQEEGLSIIKSVLYIRKAGVEIGSIIRKELVPSHQWAISIIKPSGYPQWEMDQTQALQYLRRQELPPETAYRGWVLITYKGINLGWVKVLPGRVNNYYPKDWRILNK